MPSSPSPTDTPVDPATSGGGEPGRYSRRRFLTIAGVGVGAVAVPGTAGVV